MKKKLVLLAAGLGLVVGVKAQTNIFPSSGNVGIGITSPQTSLHIKYVSTPYAILSLESSDIGQNASTQYLTGGILRWELGTGISSGSSFELYDRVNNTSRLIVAQDGNTGIGTNLPGFKLDVEGFGLRLKNPSTNAGAYTTFRIQGGQALENGLEIDYFGNPNIPSTDWAYGVGYGGAAILNVNPKPLVLGTSNLPRLFITGDGNVLIGKTTQDNPEYKLDVAGSIRANEIKVNTTGADFVFEPTYKLRSLAEVETFINQHKHLPDVAPAAEMQTNGVSMGEMQAKLLQKVEELTLYSIEQDKTKAKLEVKVEEQSKQLQEQKIQLQEQRQSSKDLQLQLAAQAKEIEQLKQFITQKLK